MIEINLAPRAEGRRAKTRSRAAFRLPSLPSLGADPRSVGIGAAVLAVVLLLGFLIWRQGRHMMELEAQITAEVADSTRYATTIALVSTLQARQDTIVQKIEVIRDVDRRRYVWPHLLDEVSAAMPAYAWLTQITSVESADSLVQGPVFSLQGSAGSTQALTGLMKNLEASAFVRDVTLVTSEQRETGGRMLHHFTLEAKYEVPDSAFVETTPILTVP